MKILATFVNTKDHPEEVELVDAWDEFSVDNNFEGFEKSRQAAIDSWGTELLRWVTVTIEIPEAQILALLNPRVLITGEVGKVEGSGTTAAPTIFLLHEDGRVEEENGDGARD